MTLKDQIWKAHPYMPRVNKLKMATHLPRAYARACEASQRLGLQPPSKYNAKNCTLISDRLSIKDEDGCLICTFDLEQPYQNRLVLASGKVITDHEYHQLLEAETQEGNYYSDCECISCINNREKQTKKKAEELSRQLSERVIIVGLPKDKKINSISPEVNQKLPNEYKNPTRNLVIVGYFSTSTDSNPT